MDLLWSKLKKYILTNKNVLKCVHGSKLFLFFYFYVCVGFIYDQYIFIKHFLPDLDANSAFTISNWICLQSWLQWPQKPPEVTWLPSLSTLVEHQGLSSGSFNVVHSVRVWPEYLNGKMQGLGSPDLFSVTVQPSEIINS